MARAIGTGILSFGLVSIPVEIHSAIQDQGIHMHLLHKQCVSRVRNQMFCPVCKVVVERADLVRGFELSKGNYVQITEEELESLEAEANNAIEFREFVPVEKLDPVYFESSYYLAPSKGAEKPYRLLAETLGKTGRVALAQTVFHEKESLVAVRATIRLRLFVMTAMHCCCSIALRSSIRRRCRLFSWVWTIAYSRRPATRTF